MPEVLSAVEFPVLARMDSRMMSAVMPYVVSAGLVSVTTEEDCVSDRELEDLGYSEECEERMGTELDNWEVEESEGGTGSGAILTRTMKLRMVRGRFFTADDI